MDKPGKKNPSPTKLPKSEREKKKREHLNEKFLALADSLEVSDQNNGKAALLIEATRFVKEMLAQIDSYKKENAALLSECHYVSVERDELKDDISALESQVDELRKEIKSRHTDLHLDLNETPPPETSPHDGPLQFSALHPHLQTMDAFHPATFCSSLQVYPTSNTEEVNPGHILKPHARYPTSSDQWTSLVLKHPGS